MKKKLPPSTKRPAREKPEPSRPAARSSGRTVLIAVSGMSPAIITETVWALAHPHDGAKPIVPDEVVVITTTKGAADLTRDLLTPNAAMGGRILWEVLRESVRTQAAPGRSDSDLLQLASPRIIELPDPKRGVMRPADDLRSLEDNAAAANFILGQIRLHVDDPETRVIASIAGGRKTMGALLYAGMSLIGRATDRVTHVLVNEPFDTCRGFFFPAQPQQNLTAGPVAKPVKLRARDAKIELADIPFVPLRNRFNDLSEDERVGGFMQLVRKMSGALAADAARTVAIKFPKAGRTIEINGRLVELENEAQVVLLRWLCSVQNAEWIHSDFKTAAAFFKAAHGVATEQGQMNPQWYKLAAALHQKNSGKSLPSGFDDDIAKALTRMFNELRSRSCQAKVPWAPAQRKLVLPPFEIVK
jgi:CRISPR-associated protein (TIGR02584 family)